MKVTVEDLSSVKKKLTVEIPQDKVTQELDNAYKELKKTAKIKGFRPGKAPRSVLEGLYKKNVNADISSKLIQESFLEAIRENDLKMIGTPQVDPPELVKNKAYEYEATIEINPEIEDIDYKGLSLNKTLYKVTDKEIDTQVKIMQQNLAKLEDIDEDRPVQEGDVVLIDYEGFKDGKSFEETQKTENFSMKVGKGQIIKEFDEEIIGMSPDEKKDVTIKFPEGYRNKKLVNHEITFHVQLKEIKKEVLPDIDDEFAKKLGPYKTLDEFKEAINANLKRGYGKRSEQELNEQIFTALIEKLNFEVPEILVKYELDDIVSDAERSFASQNISMEDAGLSKEYFAEKYKETAVRQVRRHLILGKLIDQEKLELTDDELELGFKEMAETFNQPLNDLKEYYTQNPDKNEFFKHALLEKKAINLIIENSNVKEIEPEIASASGDKNKQPEDK